MKAAAAAAALGIRPAATPGKRLEGAAHLMSDAPLNHGEGIAPPASARPLLESVCTVDADSCDDLEVAASPPRPEFGGFLPVWFYEKKFNTEGLI